MRAAFAIAVTAGVLAAGLSAPATLASETVLRVTYWGDGANAASRVTWTLRCNPPRGTLARPALACRRLAQGGPKLFAPTPPDTVCTEIYGGPQKARVIGRIGSTHVWTTFTRTNGCELARWNRISPWLVPAGGVTR